MRIKFKYLKIYYSISLFIGTLCVFLLIFQPNTEKDSKILSICLILIVIIGISGFILAVLEKLKIIEVYYSIQDRKSVFYKLFIF